MATGAQPLRTLPGALTFGGRRDVPALRELLDDLWPPAKIAGPYLAPYSRLSLASVVLRAYGGREADFGPSMGSVDGPERSGRERWAQGAGSDREEACEGERVTA